MTPPVLIIRYSSNSAISSGQHTLALVLASGQIEVPAILATIPHVGHVTATIRPVRVSLIQTKVAVLRPRLAHFPGVAGRERDLEPTRGAVLSMPGAITRTTSTCSLFKIFSLHFKYIIKNIIIHIIIMISFFSYTR